MSDAAPPAYVDARLLETLERAFAHHAGGDGRIDAKDLQRAVGLRSAELARRVLAGFDLNGDGVVSREEFFEGVRKVVFGTDREKLWFAFRVHDHDGDGFIDHAELYRMIALSLYESEVARRATVPPERLANALFLAADRNRDGRISFEEFEAVVRARPRLLHQMTRSEAQWLAPNEDLLAWLDDARARRSGRAARFLENRWKPVLVMAVWIAANLGVFVATFLRSSATDSLVRAGSALGACLSLNGALILIPVMRRFLSWVRPTWIGRVLPIDDAVDFHRIVGQTMFALAVTHAAAFVFAYALGHAWQPMTHLLLQTARGLTGSLLFVVFLVMWVFSQGVVRRSSRFELFYFTHLLYVAWLALAIAHAPSFLLWAGVSILGFAAEQISRAGRRGVPAPVVAAHALRSGVSRLEIRRPPGFEFSPGDYVFLRIPSIARFEWHPFTISSAPESPSLTVHVRTLGNWTAALRRRLEEMFAARIPGPLPAFIDGPYGSPSAHIFDSTHAVLIGAGIGVTPFASVLESLVLRSNGARPPALRKAHFFWLNRDQYSFEWFAALLRELEKADHKALLDVHLCMTGGRAGAMALGLEAAREIMHAAGRTDVVTGLRTHTHMGHPDWEALLAEIQREHAPATVDVYFCGPPGLLARLRPICARLGMRLREERF
jgi:predicted ferric reductase/Ca2+-binding EF-hand superfamily protein